MEYNVDYFIGKFSAIPEDKWTTHTRVNENHQRCALGWCYDTEEGARDSMYPSYGDSDEDKALIKVFSPICNPAMINNGMHMKYNQKTPKARILAALQDIKKLQVPETRTVTKYVAVSEDIRTKARELEPLTN